MRAVLVSLAAVAVAAAAATAAERSPTPAARLAAGAAAPLFDAADLVPGARRSACLAVANRGTARGRLALSASAARGPLAEHLRVRVSSGCDTTGALLFAGRLAEFPASARAAVLDPAPVAAGERRAYRFELALDDDRAEGLAARWDWRLATETLHAAPSSATCARVQLAGPVRGRRERVLRRGPLVLRQRGVGPVRRVRVEVPSAAARGRRGKPSAARSRRGRLEVGVLLDGRRVRGTLAAGRLRPGVLRLVVRRRGRARTVRLRVSMTTLAGRRVCVVG